MLNNGQKIDVVARVAATRSQISRRMDLIEFTVLRGGGIDEPAPSSRIRVDCDSAVLRRVAKRAVWKIPDHDVRTVKHSELLGSRASYCPIGNSRRDDRRQHVRRQGRAVI